MDQYYVTISLVGRGRGYGSDRSGALRGYGRDGREAKRPTGGEREAVVGLAGGQGIGVGQGETWAGDRNRLWATRSGVWQ